MAERDEFTKDWIIKNSIDVCSNYDDGILTLRSLHYQLVGLGMTNDIQHYKRVVSAMETARWAGKIRFEQFSDLDRSMVGETESKYTDLEDMIEEGKTQVGLWMKSYKKNRWENQPIYPEVLIEKKALQGVFAPICKELGISVGACKGYPSLTFLHDMSERFIDEHRNGKHVVVLYFGDYDPSGEDIPRSIVDNLLRFGVDIELRRIALMEDQVKKWKLPHAPAKVGDSRTASWDGIGQVELDAVKPEMLSKLLRDSVNEIWDEDLHDDLLRVESREKKIYISNLKEFVNSLND